MEFRQLDKSPGLVKYSRYQLGLSYHALAENILTTVILYPPVIEADVARKIVKLTRALAEKDKTQKVQIRISLSLIILFP